MGGPYRIRADYLREWMRDHRAAEAAVETEEEKETSDTEGRERGNEEGRKDGGEERDQTKW